MKITKISVGYAKKLQESRFEPVTFSINLEAEVSQGKDPEIEHLELSKLAYRMLEKQKDVYFREKEATKKQAEEMAKKLLKSGEEDGKE
ncbi:hypothetical protein [Candidatus Pyrohabitans sp.]